MTIAYSVLCSKQTFIPNGVVIMPRGPAHAGTAPEPGDPVPALDWMSGEEWEAWCDLTAELEDGPPPDLGWDEDPEPEPAGGERVAWTAGFAKDGLADGLPGGSELAFLAAAAAGDGDRYPGATDAELDGVIAAWDRVEAHASARKHLAIAEFIRRRPEKGCEPEVPGGMPTRWDEFAADELRVLLAESKANVERMMDLAPALAARLPGTMAQYRAGKLRQSKVTIIVDATGLLDDEESGAAADQRITAWAHELRKAGLDGDMDVLRARAYLDLLLDKDSRPEPGGGPAQEDVAPGGFAVRGNLTVPLADLLGLADRPGQLSGIGPIDPWLARDLAAAAARNPRTSWCVTATNEHGHAAFHGCARPEPKPHPESRSRDGPGFSFTLEKRDGPPGGLGTWRLRTPGPGPDLIVELYSLSTENCDHQFQAQGHNPGVKLRHLAQIRHATCASPVCRRPASQCDFEHNVPYEAGGKTCLCNGGPKCRHDHRLKQHPRWHVDQLPDGTFRWTTPSGRDYITEPTRYPI
jgi:hypothetical protein